MKSYVWYASYGSNLLEERFLCYIKGGRPEGAKRTYSGCVDKSLPVANRCLAIPYRLYFAKEAKVWNNGGVAFIHKEKDVKEQTLARMYCITKEQFMDVVMQENDLTSRPEINFSKTLNKGIWNLKGGRWYDLLLYLGEEKDEPIFTFTSQQLFQPYTLPHENYLSTIIRGIYQSHGLGPEEVFQYLSIKEGIKGFYDERFLRKLIAADEGKK